jgi:hypothetical protein
MTLHRLIHSLPVSRAILRVAASIVPREERAEWLAEWRGELWHIRQSCQTEGLVTSHNGVNVTAFCLGAFQDAFWLRRNHPHPLLRSVFRHGSPSRCGFILATWAAAVMMLCLCLPGARRAMSPSPFRYADGLVMISHGGGSSEHLPTIQLSDYQSWKSNSSHLFTELAFYQPIRRRIHLARHRTAELTIARASDNLFTVLNLRPSAAATGEMKSLSAPGVILSRAAWRRYFHEESEIAGHALEIAGQQTIILGVLPEDSWQLPGQIDAWMLEDKPHLDAIPSNARGFVLARINSSGFPAGSAGQRYMTVSEKAGESARYACISLAQRARMPVSVFLFTLLLACLALPATTPLPLGEYPARGERLTSAMQFRRWLFLAIKISLILPLIYFGSLDLAYAGLSPDSPSAEYIQLLTSFFGFLFAFRWALQDQRRRCPVCLRLLTSPARVGQPSQNFLAWNGTELICSAGHGLLHIPELPTSWFSTQRWLCLDSSWNSLFSDTHLISAGIS